jgi:uncharacterized RDD family membrane protein YckC
MSGPWPDLLRGGPDRVSAVPETASWLHRIAALFVDWFASTLVVIAFAGPSGWRDDPWSGSWTLGVFVVESALLTTLLGGSFGKLVTRLRVIRADGSGAPISLLVAFIRSVMVALVIPPMIFRPDGRGLHDMAVGSATVRLADLQGGVHTPS